MIVTLLASTGAAIVGVPVLRRVLRLGRGRRRGAGVGLRIDVAPSLASRRATRRDTWAGVP